MRALYFDQKLRLVDIPKPVPKQGEALVKVLLTGICRTDLEITQGYMNFTGVLGHEFVGRVESCGLTPELAGKRIVGEINIAPWTNDSLTRRHDPQRTVLGIVGKDGCFAEYVTLPIENLFVIPDEVDDKEAVFIEPLAAAQEILEQVDVQSSQEIAVVGDGKLGLLCAQVLALTGGTVTLIGKHTNKLDIARGFGLKTIHLSDLSRSKSLKFDIVVDCAGRPDGLALSLNLVRPRGTLVLKTTTAAPPEFHTAQIVIDEITIVGSRCGPFEPAIDILKHDQVRVEPLIEKIYSLEDGLAAFEHANQPGVLKILLDIEKNRF